MFKGCTSLENANVSTWNTSKVTDMSGLFDGCAKLSQLDLSSFNTEELTNMNQMFREAAHDTEELTFDLITREITKEDRTTYTAWDVSSVTDMFSMFYLFLAINSSMAQYLFHHIFLYFLI